MESSDFYIYEIVNSHYLNTFYKVNSILGIYGLHNFSHYYSWNTEFDIKRYQILNSWWYINNMMIGKMWVFFNQWKTLKYSEINYFDIFTFLKDSKLFYFYSLLDIEKWVNFRCYLNGKVGNRIGGTPGLQLLSFILENRIFFELISNCIAEKEKIESWIVSVYYQKKSSEVLLNELLNLLNFKLSSDEFSKIINSIIIIEKRNHDLIYIYLLGG